MAQMAETVSLLERAGLIMIVEDGDGREAYLLSADGERVNRMRTMASGSDVDAVLAALLGAGLAPKPPPSAKIPIRPSI